MKVPVLTAAAGAGWEAVLVGALAHGSHGISVARRCVDVVDLLAVAAAGQAQAALVAAELRRFDADAVDRLVAAEVVPVGVVPRGDASAEARMRASGVAHIVAADADPDTVSSVVTDAVMALAGQRPSSRGFGDPLAGLPILVPGSGTPEMAGPGRVGTPEPGAPGTQQPPAPYGQSTGRGSVIAVWGPTGAPGRTTVATGLADDIARLGVSSLLVDADVYGGTVASALGLLDESPGLAAACRLAGTTRLDVAALAQLCWQIRPGLRVLTGIPLAQRWPEVRAAAIPAVLAAARSLAEFTVVDCGFGLEMDEELSFDTLAPRRNGATLAVLDGADTILVVGSADPVGVQRLVRGLAEIRTAQVLAPIWVVVNQVRRGVVPGDPDVELAAALDRFSGYTPAALLPYDRDGLDAAAATGRLLADAKPSSPLRKATAQLAAALVGVPVATPRHRKVQLTRWS